MRSVRKSKEETELLTDEKIEKAILMLEPSSTDKKTFSKKEICNYLGISYNTTRLDSIIREYKDKKAIILERKKEKLGKPASKEEIQFCVSSYLLEDMSIASIAASLYRSTTFVSNILDQAGVTLRPISHDYFNPVLISDSCCRDRFDIGETVYNARYNVNCIIKGETPDAKYGYVYKVWLLGEYQQYAFTAVYDLGSLDVLKRVS